MKPLTVGEQVKIGEGGRWLAEVGILKRVWRNEALVDMGYCAGKWPQHYWQPWLQTFKLADVYALL